MTEKIYFVGELAEISGTTIRAIQYYDKIGLLKANRQDEYGDGFRPLVRNFRPVNAE